MEVRHCEGRGRALFVQAAVSAGTTLLSEPALVSASPAAHPAVWSNLLALQADEDYGLALEPEWYILAAAAVTVSLADSNVAAAIGDKYRPDGWMMGDEMQTFRVLEALGMLGAVTPVDFQAALAAVRFNAFKTEAADGAYAVYDRVSMINHSCCPSAYFCFDDQHNITICALHDLPAGSEVTISYLNRFSLLQSTEMRRLKLEDRDFTCHCPRCDSALDLCRGFRCPRATCSGTCFLPASDEPTTSAPCHVCGDKLTGDALNKALEWESQYGFVVEHGDLSGIHTAEGLTRGADSVFRQHWILTAILFALLQHRATDGPASEAEAAACRAQILDFQAAALAQWPWMIST